MKALITIFLFLFLLSCGNKAVDKPDNLIDEDVMVDILYDLSILDAIRSQKPMSMERHKINPKTYVYNKYDIDSIQFAQSNRYYSSDVEKYKKLYEAVDKKIETEKKRAEDELKKSGKQPVANPDEPMVR